MQGTTAPTQSSMHTSTRPLSASMARCSSSAVVISLRMQPVVTTGPSGSPSSQSTSQRSSAVPTPAWRGSPWRAPRTVAA
eukprot:349862-Rhodomonas_salina.1